MVKWGLIKPLFSKRSVVSSFFFLSSADEILPSFENFSRMLGIFVHAKTILGLNCPLWTTWFQLISERIYFPAPWIAVLISQQQKRITVTVPSLIQYLLRVGENDQSLTLKEPGVIYIEVVYRVEKMWMDDILSKEAHEQSEWRTSTECTCEDRCTKPVCIILMMDTCHCIIGLSLTAVLHEAVIFFLVRTVLITKGVNLYCSTFLLLCCA